MNEQPPQQNFTYNITTVAVKHGQDIAPYIDTFTITPQNIIQREHGSLIGFFRIYDTSEDSAYIANFLTSVLKKEFYASTKRPTETALESALSKVNLALSELANIDVAQWVGKVDGAVVAITPQTICFSTCGSGGIFLFRNNTLNSVSNEIADTDTLSTFSDIARGPLQTGDTFLVGSREFMEVLPHNDCERACQRYTTDEREQLFRTALVNRTDNSCVHMIDIMPMRSEIALRTATFDLGKEPIDIPDNVFSAQTFDNAHQKRDSAITKKENKGTSAKSTVTQKQRGHYYLQGNQNDTERTPFSEILMEHTSGMRASLNRAMQSSKNSIAHTATTTKNHAFQITRSSKSFLKKSLSSALYTAHKTSSTAMTSLHSTRKVIAQKAQSIQEKRTINGIQTHTQKQTYQEETDSIPDATKNKTHTKQSFTELYTSATTQKRPAEIATNDAVTESQEIHSTDALRSIDRFLTPKPLDKSSVTETSMHSLRLTAKSTWRILQRSCNIQTLGKYLHRAQGSLYTYCRIRTKNITQTLRAAMPHPQKLPKMLDRMSRTQKVQILIIIIIIIAAPLLFMKLAQNKETLPANSADLVADPQEEVAATLPVDSSSTKINRVHTLNTDITTLTLLVLNGTRYIINPRSLTRITSTTDKNTVLLPSAYADITHAVAMNDLNLILLVTKDRNVISYAPRGSTKFTKNTIKLPQTLSIDAVGVYRTYLYLADDTANDIYRYPRDIGGFGSATNWLSDNTNISPQSTLAIDGTIYAAQNNGSILTLFKRKRASFKTPTMDPALYADAVLTPSEASPLYVLDNVAGRIVAINKETGSVAQNLYNEDFHTAKTFIVNERLTLITALLADGTLATYRY